MIELWVPGAPKGKDRPRFSRKTGRTYTTAQTTLAEEAVRRAWHETGSVRLPDGPLELGMRIQVCRPNSHRRKGGDLTKEGLAMPMPSKQKPDIDNCMKLVLDALNGHAYTDDVRVVRAAVERVWADEPGVRVRLRPL